MVSLQSLALLVALSSPGQVSGAGETVLLQFTADWCGPCQTVKPIVTKLSAAGHPIRVVNIDRERALAAEFRVTKIPCFVMLVNGKEVDRQLGVPTQDQLLQMLAAAQQPQATAVPAARGQSPDDAGFRSAAAPAAGADVEQSSLLQSTVRLKVEDQNGHSFGTGTIIDARSGSALVLTCGHIFRDSAGKGRVTIDLVGLQGTPQCEGQVLSYDLKRDIGLVMITPPVSVVVAPVAPAETKLALNDRVCSVGCNNGHEPTVLASYVSGVDKYMGPPNIEVAGMPVEGRSGGGLFNEQGWVVGVCFAADPKDNEGVYAGLESIHAELDRIGLSELYQNSGQSQPAQEPVAQMPSPPAMSSQMPQPTSDQADPWSTAPRDTADRAPLITTSLNQTGGTNPFRKAGTGTDQLSPAEQATLAEIYARGEDAEVICIIRPLSNPNGKSEIIVLDRASPAFLQEISGRQLPRADRQLTSHAVPRKTSAPVRQAQRVPDYRRPDYSWRPKQ